MASIFVKISDIPGDATQKGYEKQIQCVAMRHVYKQPLDLSKARKTGQSKHGAIALTHTADKASPLLKKNAMATSNNQGTVVITRLQTGGVAETIQITNAAVVRVDLETPLSPATLQPGDDLMETFYLDYSDGAIRWSHQNVEGNWSVANGEVPA